MADLFQIALSHGIYQTMYLWAELSPNLVSPDDSESPAAGDDSYTEKAIASQNIVDVTIKN